MAESKLPMLSGRSRIPSPLLATGRSRIPSPTTASPLTRIASPTENKKGGRRSRVSSPQPVDEGSRLSPGRRSQVTSPQPGDYRSRVPSPSNLSGRPRVTSPQPLNGRPRVTSPQPLNGRTMVTSPQPLNEQSRVPSPSFAAERQRTSGRPVHVIRTYASHDSMRPQTYFSNSRRTARRATDEKKGPPSEPTLYLTVVRHGETNHNLNRILQGHIDTPLNKTGLEQAEILSRRLQKIKFDHIYTSDLARARRTAKIVAKNHPGVPFDTDMRLREKDLGSLSGLSIYDALNVIKEEGTVWEDYGEPEEDFKARVVDFFDEIVKKHLPRMSPKSAPGTPPTPSSTCSSPELQNPPKRSAHVLLVAHGGTINQLVKHHLIMDLGFSVKDYKSIQSKPKNTSVTKVIIRRAAGDDGYESEDESDGTDTVVGDDRLDVKKAEEDQDGDNASEGHAANDAENSLNEGERSAAVSDGERTVTGDSESAMDVQDLDVAEEQQDASQDTTNEEESLGAEHVDTRQSEEVDVDSTSARQLPAENESSRSLEQPKKSRPPPLINVKEKKSPKPLKLEGDLTTWSDVSHLTAVSKRTHGDSAIDEHVY